MNDCFSDDAVEDTEEIDIPLSSVSIGRRPFCNLRCADDIDLLGGSEELQQRLEKTAADYGMEISSDKSKIIANSIKPRPSTNIWMNGNMLEEVNHFKY